MTNQCTVTVAPSERSRVARGDAINVVVPIGPDNCTVCGCDTSADDDMWMLLRWDKAVWRDGVSDYEYLHVESDRDGGVVYRVRSRVDVGQSVRVLERGKPRGTRAKVIEVRVAETEPGKWSWIIRLQAERQKKQ